MSKQRTVFEMNGKTYYSTQAAADKWEMKQKEVTTACREGRIIGAIKDSTNQWCIPDTAMKPLEKENIRKLLIITLYLKNNPNLTLSELDRYDIPKLYTYLKDIDYIKPFNENSDRIPYEAVLTNKGMGLVIENKKIDIDWANIAELFIQCIPPLLEIGSGLIHN